MVATQSNMKIGYLGAYWSASIMAAEPRIRKFETEYYIQYCADNDPDERYIGTLYLPVDKKFTKIQIQNAVLIRHVPEMYELLKKLEIKEAKELIEAMDKDFTEDIESCKKRNALND